MCLVTWTERLLFWLKLDLVASIMCNPENLDQWSPWPWTVPTAPALALAVPVYSRPALSGVTFQYQSPQLWFPPGLGCPLSQCGLSVWQSCLLLIFLPSLAALPVPCPCPHATASPQVPDPEFALAQGDSPLWWSLHICVLKAAQVPISLQSAVWFPATSLVCCDPNWTKFFSPPPSNPLLLPHWPRSESHIRPATQVQNERSLLAPLSPSGLSIQPPEHHSSCTFSSSLSYHSHLFLGHLRQPPDSASYLWPFLHPVVARSPCSSAGLAASLPLPISLPSFPLLSVPPPSPPANCCLQDKVKALLVPSPASTTLQLH